MMSTILQQETVRDAFEQVTNLLHDVCHEVERAYGKARLQAWGWDYDEMFAMASLWFVEAHGKFDNHRGRQHICLASRFVVYVKCYVLNRFKDRVRRHAERGVKLTRADIDVEIVVARETAFDANPLLDQLGKDARTIVELILSSPAELFCKTEQANRSLLVCLLSEVGWCATRIASAMEEVSTVLFINRI